jgi:PAS domain S-box-containing protein
MHLPDFCLRAAVDEASDGLLVEVGPAIAYMNEGYALLLGYRSAEELLGAKIDAIVAARDVERLQYFSSCRLSGRPAPLRYDFWAQRSDGALMPLEASVSTTRIASDLLITTVARPPVQAATGGAPVGSELKGLSARERQVFDALIEGQRPKEIALQLNISPKTVTTLTARMYAKLALRNSLDLFRFAARRGLLEV